MCVVAQSQFSVNSGSTENDSLVVVCEYFPLDVFFYGTREDNFLKVASFEHEALWRVFMAYSHHVLLYYRSGVEFGGHVVAPIIFTPLSQAW